MSWKADGSGGDLAERGDAEVDGRGAACAFVELGELAFGAREADTQALGLPEPTLLLGLGDPGNQVVADLDQAWPLSWVNAKERASFALLTELAGEFGQVLTLHGEGAASLPA